MLRRAGLGLGLVVEFEAVAVVVVVTGEVVGVARWWNWWGWELGSGSGWRKEEPSGLAEVVVGPWGSGGN